jgi:hypothetical protein
VEVHVLPSGPVVHWPTHHLAFCPEEWSIEQRAAILRVRNNHADLRRRRIGTQ